MIETNDSGRRNFLKEIATASFGVAAIPGVRNFNNDPEPTGTAGMDKSTFPVYNVLDHGVINDEKTLNSKAIQAVIDFCSAQGGGTVLFPPGVYLTGTIQFKKNVTLYLSPGATILGSPDLKEYHSGCLIYAEDADNISITGMGTMNGNGKSFWGKLAEQGMDNDEMIKVIKRPGNMMQFVRCNNLLIEGITIQNTPGWTIHPIDCDRVLITGISMLCGTYEDRGPNFDGIDPDGCTNVRISDCYLVCGDDCIVLKITNRPGGRKICRDIVVTNCILETPETALKIGTETFGEFHNITFSNCSIRESGNGFGIWMRDGGIIDGVVVSNIAMDCTRIKNCQGILIWSHRRTDDTPWGIIRNVIVSGLTIRGAGGIFVTGVPEKHMEGIIFENIRIHIHEGRSTKHHENPPYPTLYYGCYRISPCDIFCRYVDDLKISNVQLIWDGSEKAEWGSALRCWHVNWLEINAFSGRQSLLSDAPAISLKNVNDAFIHDCWAPYKTGTFLYADKESAKVSLMGNELSRVKKAFETDSDADTGLIYESGNRLP